MHDPFRMNVRKPFQYPAYQLDFYLCRLVEFHANEIL